MNGLVQQRRFRMGKTAVVTLVTEVIKIECTLCVVTLPICILSIALASLHVTSNASVCKLAA